MQRYFQPFGAMRCGLIGLLLALSVPHPIFAQTSVAPPTVSILSPTNGAVFYTPVSIQIIAKATSPSNSITNVEFFAGTNQLPGNVLQLVLDPPGINGVTGLVYLLNWSNVLAGSYTLTAVATDNHGISGTSAPVNITVLPFSPPPVVRITSPPNHAVFHAPVNIPLFAFASATYPTANSNIYTAISNVEFFAGTMDLGPAHRVVVEPPGPLLPPAILLPYEFTLIWSNAPPGAYVLTAVATDDHGISATSAPVNIVVLRSTINTNGLDVVSIVATDPVAIEGTNCWVWPGLPTPTPTWAAWQQPAWTLFTNCGPKDATFMVRRAGSNSNDLVVPYAISGTASNGVNYDTLPGFVTIPAGQNYALINVVPIDGTPPPTIETVILTLEPSTNIPPNYLVGYPPRAAAIIFDSTSPHPPTGVLPGFCFHFNASGPDGAWFGLEYSTNMTAWVPVATNQVVNGCIDFVDPDAVAGANRFYQAFPLTNAPSQ